MVYQGKETWVYRSVFVTLLVGALGLRVWLALITPQIVDEGQDWLLLVNSISFDPDNLVLPLRGRFHATLPAYVVKLSGILFGEDILGFRILNILIGVVTVGVIFLIARRVGGRSAGLWAAALLSANEYHVSSSGLAIQRSLYLLCAAGFLYFVVHYIEEERSRDLYAAAILVALGYYCYEISVLWIPAAGIAVLIKKGRAGFLHRHAWQAFGVTVLLLTPDIVWNMTHMNPAGQQVSTINHLERLQSISVTPEYFKFFLRDLGQMFCSAYALECKVVAREYWAMNSFVGATMLAGVLWATFAIGRRDSKTLWLSVCFWCVFGFFTLLGTSATNDLADGSGWWWVDCVLLPAVILTAVMVVRLEGATRWAACGATALGIFVGVAHMVDVEQSPVPPVKLRIFPNHLMPQNNQMVPLRAEFLVAPLFAPVKHFELVSVDADCTLPATNTAQPTPHIVGAANGKADRTFSVSATFPCEYATKYRVVDARGCESILERRIYARPPGHDQMTARFHCPEDES